MKVKKEIERHEKKRLKKEREEVKKEIRKERTKEQCKVKNGKKRILKNPIKHNNVVFVSRQEAKRSAISRQCIARGKERKVTIDQGRVDIGVNGGAAAVAAGGGGGGWGRGRKILSWKKGKEILT